MNPSIIKAIKKAPNKPGIYIFLRNNDVFYVGKASNLKSRLKSYLKIHDLKTKILHKEATRLKLVKLSSPIEALIRESQLIKTLKPRYNILWQDDKNYFYVAFTKEKFPKIYITHQPFGAPQGKPLVIGPFTDGASLKIVIRLLRRHFPYCTCFKPHLRECLNSQINNCLGFCCSKNITATKEQIKKYRENIKKIRDILSGKNRNFIKKLQTPSELMAVENIYSHSNFLNSKFEIQNSKLECYDISHFAGKEAVGAYTVLVNQNNQWQPDVNSFRKFKIKSTETKNDPNSIAEILSRRLNHPEWHYPEIILIDGGITQYNAAKKVLNKFFLNKNYKPALLSFAKPERRIYGEKIISEEIIKKAIEQTHRFVIKFHRQTRVKMLDLN